jgi:hypothetical protein
MVSRVASSVRWSLELPFSLLIEGELFAEEEVFGDECAPRAQGATA